MSRRVLCLTLALVVVTAAVLTVAADAAAKKPKKAKGKGNAPDGKPFKPEMYPRSRSRYPTVFAPYQKAKPIPGSHVPEIPELPCQCAHPLPSSDVQRCRKWVKAEAYICDGADGKCRRAPVKHYCPCVHASLKRECLHFAPPGSKVVSGISDADRLPRRVARNWLPPSASRRDMFEPVYHSGVPEHRHKKRRNPRVYDRATYRARRAEWLAKRRAAGWPPRVNWVSAVPGVEADDVSVLPRRHILPPLPRWVPPPKLQRYQRSVYPQLGDLAKRYPNFDFNIERDDLDFLLDRDDDAEDFDDDFDLDYDDIDGDAFDDFDDYGNYLPAEGAAVGAAAAKTPSVHDLNAVHRTGVIRSDPAVPAKQQPAVAKPVRKPVAKPAQPVRKPAQKPVRKPQPRKPQPQRKPQKPVPQRKPVQQRKPKSSRAAAKKRVKKILKQIQRRQRKAAQQRQQQQQKPKPRRRRVRLFGDPYDDAVHLPMSFPVSKTFEVLPASPRADARNPNRVTLHPAGTRVARPMPGVTEEDVDVMARTLWGEARGEEEEGQRAIAWAIVNRAAEDNHGHRRFPNTIAGVCQQSKQFSIWVPTDTNHSRMRSLPRGDPTYQKMRAIAAGVVNGILPDITFGSKFYYANTIVRPPWAKNMNCSVKIGRHYFCRDHD